MLNATPPKGPKTSLIMRRGGPSRGGITKRSGPRGVRVDKDGDLDMDAPARSATRQARGGGAPHPAVSRMDTRVQNQRGRGASGSGVLRAGPSRPHTRGQGLIEVTVLGWQESRGTRDSLVDFLERKSGVKIKKSRTQGDALIISVPFLQVDEILKWDNCQFAGSRLAISANAAPRILPKRDDELMEAGIGSKDETVKILEQVLATRYNAASKMLDFTRLGEDPILRQTGFFDLASTTSKMFPALMLVAERKFETVAAKRDAVISVSLAYNNLKDVRVVSSLAATFPDIKNLSLEGNLIPSWKELDYWRHKFRRLEQLILTGNPIVATEGYKEEAMRRYPALNMLDTVTLDRPVIKIGVAPDAQVPLTIPGDVSSSGIRNAAIPLGVKAGCVMDPSGVGMQFLSNFFTLYDTDPSGLLASFYDESSKFSIAANTLAPRAHQPGVVIPQKPWEPYYPTSRNLARVYGQQLLNKLYIGPQKILEAWASLPKTKHDVSNSNLWVFDIWPIQGLPDVNNPTNYEGVTGLIATVHGEFEEVPATAGAVPLKRSFDRSFTLAPGGGPLHMRVINDMMVIRAWGNSEAWVPTPDPIANPANPVGTANPPINNEELVKQQKVSQLRQQTNLNVQFATLCLEENGWEFDAALKAFEAAKAKGLVPREAFA